MSSRASITGSSSHQSNFGTQNDECKDNSAEGYVPEAEGHTPAVLLRLLCPAAALINVFSRSGK
ncbi:hypothetical protein IG631_03640 [Alternaria alternata]|nr:hypothetical protein IG631_03640 [Alternaria alternata]